MPHFLPLRSWTDWIGEFGITITTLLASERVPKLTILMSCPSLMAETTGAGEVSP